MVSLVEKLRDNARNPNFPVSELLMDAKIVAKNADYREFDKWIDNELNGYNTLDIPDYRKVDCKLEYTYISTGEWCHLDLVGERFNSIPLDQPIGELSTYLNDNVVYFNVPRDPLDFLKTRISNSNFRAVVDSNRIKRIIDIVRNKIWDFALELEKGTLIKDVKTNKTESLDKLPDSLPSRIINDAKRIFADTDTGLSSSRIDEFFEEVIEELDGYRATEEFYVGQFSSKKEVFAYKLKHLPLNGQILALYRLSNKPEFKNHSQVPDLIIEIDREIKKLGLENEFKELTQIFRKDNADSNKKMPTTITKNLEHRDAPVNKIFISHSSKDKKYILKLFDMLQAIGVSHESIFCTSIPGCDVDFCKNILDELKNELNENILVLYILSDNFYNSPICMCEMGATWVRSMPYIPVILPGFDYGKIKGVISSFQTGLNLTDKNDLNKFKVHLTNKCMAKELKHDLWELKRDGFIEDINNIKEKENSK